MVGAPVLSGALWVRCVGPLKLGRARCDRLRHQNSLPSTANIDTANIDRALWDSKSKAWCAGASVAGCHCRVRNRIFSWVGGDRPRDATASAKDCVVRGFSAVNSQ
jgi:hypothetical protein